MHSFGELDGLKLRHGKTPRRTVVQKPWRQTPGPIVASVGRNSAPRKHCGLLRCRVGHPPKPKLLERVILNDKCVKIGGNPISSARMAHNLGGEPPISVQSPPVCVNSCFCKVLFGPFSHPRETREAALEEDRVVAGVADQRGRVRSASRVRSTDA